MSVLPIQIGILGCANVARKISRAINLSQGAEVHAVGSRSMEKAKKFAADNCLPETTKLYDSYGAVVGDSDIDAVYIPLPTSLHAEWAVSAARQGKHVLIEKPAALNVEEYDEIMEACESSGVQLMDGTMWVHHPRTIKMKEFLDDPDLFGQLKSIHSVFTFDEGPDFLENNIRVKPNLDSLGALGDAGWYCIRAILWATNYELPTTVISWRNPVYNKSGVLMSCGANFYWQDGKTASFECSFISNRTIYTTAIGTNGTLYVNDFVVPFEELKGRYMTGTKNDFTELLTEWKPKLTEHVVVIDVPQEVEMVEEFSRLVSRIKYGGLKPEKKWAVHGRLTQVLVDAVMASIQNDFEPVEISQITK